jgi:hypothetical protein
MKKHPFNTSHLADFGSVTFSDLSVGVPGGTWYLPSYTDAIEMATPGGSVEVSTSPVLGTGTSAAFTVFYETSG